jgi:hypothetical protein
MHRLPALCLALLAAIACGTLSACTSAGLCTRGELGCACTQNQRCDEGRCDDGMCVESDGPPDAGAPDSGRDAGPPVDCSGDTLDNACEDFCEAFCQNQERLCIGSTCLPGDCDPGGDLLQVCYDECSTASCAQRSCESQRDHTCDSFGYLDPGSGVFLAGCFDNDPVCVLDPVLGCSDTCGVLQNASGGDLAANDLCEDGGEGSDGSLCPRSTDCTDCGVRACADVGQACEDHGDCCAFFNDASFCVEVETGRAQCLSTCTDTRSCPNGAACLPVDDNRNFVCAP